MEHNKKVKHKYLIFQEEGWEFSTFEKMHWSFSSKLITYIILLILESLNNLHEDKYKETSPKHSTVKMLKNQRKWEFQKINQRKIYFQRSNIKTDSEMLFEIVK